MNKNKNYNTHYPSTMSRRGDDIQTNIGNPTKYPVRSTFYKGWGDPPTAKKSIFKDKM